MICRRMLQFHDNRGASRAASAAKSHGRRRLPGRRKAYPETRQALMRIWRSGGGFDLDIISEILDATHEAHGCAGLVITSKVVRSEVAKEGTVAQHMLDGGEDRCG